MKRIRKKLPVDRVCTKCKKSNDFYKPHSYHCKDCQRKYAKTKAAENPERHLENAIKWQSENKERYKFLRKRSRDQIRKKVLDAYGNKCACCSESLEKLLTLDHINNDGKTDREKYGYSNQYSLCLKRNFPDTYQLLCYNCNLGRAKNNGICPHKTQNEKTN